MIKPRLPKPKRRSHATALQMEQAILEQMKHARGMNVPINSILNSILSAVSFSILVHNRLFGERDLSSDFRDAYLDLTAAARAEREQWRKTQEQTQSKIILPS